MWVSVASSCALLCATLGAPEVSSATPSPESLDNTLARATTGETQRPSQAGELLSGLDAEYHGLLVAERLPRTGSYLVEVEASWEDQKFRLPVKVARRDGGGWRIRWMPDRAYLEALVEVFDAGKMVEISTDRGEGWTEARRLPALPIILHDGQAVTPFGAVTLRRSGRVDPPEELGRAIGRWVDAILERDPGPAAVDILAADDTRWHQMTQILFAAATAGMFRVHLVVRPPDSDHLRALSMLAPVFESGTRPDRASSFVAGMYRASPAEIRLLAAERQLGETEGRCPESMSICPDSPAAFERALPDLVEASFPEKPPKIAQVLFAATGNVRVSRALPYALRLPSALGIPLEKLYLGHIGETENDGRSR